MPLSPTRLFVCTACGGVLPVGEEHLGKKCRCGRCGKISLISAESPPPAGQPAATTAPVEPSRRQISLCCRVCDTRLAARAKDAGRKAKCPSCGAVTEVPPPPRQHPSERTQQKVPEAMHGQQYGLWKTKEAPDPHEIAARQPKYFPVYCRVCDTLMHARPEQVGKKLACPDCGAKTDVKAPPPPKPKKSALVPDGQEYQLDAPQAAATRPEMQFEAPAPAERNAAAESIRTERPDRPKQPRLPIVSGVTPMLFRNPVVGWWFGLSIAGCIELGILAIGVTGHILVKLVIVPPLMAIGAVSCCAAGALLLAVLTESSEGNDRVYHPPGPVFLDWLGSVFYIITSGMLALAPWWLLCRVFEQQMSPAQQGILQGCGWLFTFPLLLLSSLENGSPLELFSPRVFNSVSKLPGRWLLLVVESVLLASGCLVAVAGLLVLNPWLAFLAVPLCMAALLLYFRLLGRFAWWLAESLAGGRAADSEEA